MEQKLTIHILSRVERASVPSAKTRVENGTVARLVYKCVKIALDVTYFRYMPSKYDMGGDLYSGI